ncbi:MAG: copper-binding protein, partial [Verrucomicrobiales bacterium]|nr:copper-binding protein [Verrucomicrobiales bacterium]
MLAMKSGVRWATGFLVLLNVVFFGLYLWRAPGRRSADRDTGATSAVPEIRSQAGVYAVTGVVRELRDGGSNVLIRHEAIPGFMAAMSMPFAVRDPREVA